LVTPVLAEGTKQDGGVLHEKNTNSSVKMNENLLNQWSDENKMVTFLVKFNEKADTKKVAEEAKNQALTQQLSGQQAELQQRSSVVNTLKETSLTEQQNVRQFLEKEMKNENVEEVRPYYIVNAMAVTATR